MEFFGISGRPVILGLGLMMLLSTPLLALAQNVGTITGSVVDPQGLALPGVSVTATSRVSSAIETAVSDQQGRYTLSNVPFGTYVLAAVLPGFVTSEQVVEVRSTVPITRQLSMAVGGISETVSVTADALLESSTGSHVSLGTAAMEQLPTATPSKQMSAVLLSAPGFIPSQNGRVHVRGSHGQIQYVVDGVPLTDEFSEAFANPLDPRYVKSAEVMTAGVPAEYGGKLAAVVDITSRSGLDEPRRAFGNASVQVGSYASADGGAVVGGRIGQRVAYFVSGGANRTNRYLDTPMRANLHNSGAAQRLTGKLEMRPSSSDLVRVVFSANGSDFAVPNTPLAQTLGVDFNQTLRDNSQTVTWMRQLREHATFDAIAYRRAATAVLDGRTGIPIAAEQDRSLDHQGGSASISYVGGAHRLKTGVQYDRNPLREHFSMRGTDPTNATAARFDPRAGGVPFVFDGNAVAHNVGAFVQDTFSPTDDLHIQAGVRWDRYKLLVDETAVSPRLGVAYHLHGTETVLRASYNRVFMPPFAENLLVSSSVQTRALSPNRDTGGGVDVRPERQHAFEVGAQQALGAHARLDVAYYRKDMRNVADVDQFADTTVTFPIAVAKGVAQGIETRLDIPAYRGVSGYVSLSRASILLTAPLTGGAFLGALPEAGTHFYADHDQRWQSQFGVAYERSNRRGYGSISGRYDSGIPFVIPADFDAATFEDPYALTLVNLDNGRAKPRVLLNALAGSEIYRHSNTRLDLQVGVLNLSNTPHVLNFLSIFNGTHYGPPRTWTARLRVSF